MTTCYGPPANFELTLYGLPCIALNVSLAYLFALWSEPLFYFDVCVPL